MRDDIGDLMTQRPLPGRDLEQIDPFLFLNHHGPQIYAPHNRGLPFGPHPHRGFETVTFILDGMLAHQDSAGHESIIRAGGVQWMTAGSGIVHAEISPREFLQQRRPARNPAAVGQPAAAPENDAAGLHRPAARRDPGAATPDGKGVVNLVAGEWEGRTGPVQPLTGVFMTTIELAAGARVEFPGLASRNVFLYVVRGSVKVAGQPAPRVPPGRTQRAGDARARSRPSRTRVLLFGHAEPIGAPVVSHGPFVMNTREEICRRSTTTRPASSTRSRKGARA